MRRWIDRVRLRLRSVFRAGDADHALLREIEGHLEDETAQNVAAGMSPSAARDAALRAFGPMASIEEQCRDTRRVAFVSNLLQDIRYACRAMSRQPLLVAAATASIAVAVSVNATVFNLANQFLLAYPTAFRADRLVRARMNTGSHVSYRQWRDLHDSGALKGPGSAIRLEGHAEPFQAMFAVNFVGPEYFATIGIRLLRGREFQRSDRPGAPGVAIINEEFARRYAPNSDPLGRTLMLPGPSGLYPTQIVGIAANSKHRTIGEDQRPAVYESYLQRGSHNPFLHLVLRMTPGTQPPAREIAQVLAELDPSAAIEVQTMRQTLAFALMPSQVGAALLGIVAVLAVALAVGGLYAATVYSVSRRTAEIGIRMALGATPRAVLNLVLGDAGVLAGIGIAIGLALAVLVTQPLAMFLVSGLSAADPTPFAVTAVLLVLIGLAAAWVPARRALAIDPARALRDE